jgi:hypothetical protein
MNLSKQRGLVLMQRRLDQRLCAIRPPTHDFSVPDSNKSTDDTKLRDSICHRPGTDSMRAQVRLRAESGALPLDRRREPQNLLRELKKIELILDAKRSQLKKMQQLSKLKFINKLISHAYLDEVAADIVWHEALLEKTASELWRVNTLDPLSLSAPSSSPPATTGTSN